MRKILIATSLTALALLASCSTTTSSDTSGAEGDLSVVYLKNVSSAELAVTLRGFLEQEAAAAGKPQKVVIQSDAHSNSLLIRASGEKWRQLALMIDKLDIKRS
tara:strand:- start:82085 stop:82396 length:312 start_codon:yes stop_codon:yes gene_type:complete